MGEVLHVIHLFLIRNLDYGLQIIHNTTDYKLQISDFRPQLQIADVRFPTIDFPQTNLDYAYT